MSQLASIARQAWGHAKEQLQLPQADGKPLKNLRQEMYDQVWFLERSLWPLCGD